MAAIQYGAPGIGGDFDETTTVQIGVSGLAGDLNDTSSPGMQAAAFWRFLPSAEEHPIDWRPPRRAIIANAPPARPAGNPVGRRPLFEEEEAPPWYPLRRILALGQFSPAGANSVRGRLFLEGEEPSPWYPLRRTAALGQIAHATARISAASALQSSPSLGLRARITAASSALTGFLSGLLAPRVLVDPDPLWVAVEIDLWDTNLSQIATLRLSNRGPLTRNVMGTVYQYLPRLQVPILLGTTLNIFSGGGSSDVTMFQQPLRGQPNAGTIAWAVDPDIASWLNPGRYRWLGRTFRVYEGRTATEVGIDVDANLTLVYTGHVAGLTYDLASTSGPTATIQTTDASSDLDKSLVDDLYPASFQISSLQGKPKPQLWGRAVSIVPTLEDTANLIYRVTRIEPGVVELDDITEVRVGGVPWRRAAGLPSVHTYLISQVVGPSYLGFNMSPADVAFWQSTGATLTLSASLPPLRPGDALYTIVQAVGPSYIGALAPADVAFWVGTGATVAPYTGTPPPSPPPPLGSGPAQGEWAADLASGTFQLGAVTLGAEVRCDAQMVGWQTFDTAALITAICTKAAVPTDPAYLAQLHIDSPGLIGFFTDAPINCLDALDQITLANLSWWGFGADGAVIAGIVDGPEIGKPDFVVFGSDPGKPLDSSILPIALDPIPKELASISLTQLIPPAWRARTEYERHWSPETQFLPGVTEQEQAHWRVPGLIRDWSPGDSAFALSPADGDAIHIADPRAQDIYIRTLAWREVEAAILRSRLVQRITGNLEREVYSITVWMPASQIRLFQIVDLEWIDDNARTQASYGGRFRVTSAIRSIGGGPQQLELWGTGGATAAPR